MAYIPTVWADEIPDSSPVKYKITDDVGGELAGSAEIELVTDVTAGTPLNAANLNKMETGIAGAIQKDIATTKGDLLYASAAETIARLGIGTPGNILRASSGGTPAWENLSFCKVRRTGAEAIPDATATMATFTEKSITWYGDYWVVGNPSRLTVDKNGLYMIGGYVSWSVNNVGIRELKLYSNGSTMICGNANIALTGVVTHSNLSTILYATTGTYFELRLWQNSGGALNHGAYQLSEFWMLYLGY